MVVSVVTLIVPLLMALVLLRGGDFLAPMRRTSVARAPHVANVATTWRETPAEELSLCTGSSSSPGVSVGVGAGTCAHSTPPRDASHNAGSHQYPYLATILTIIICVFIVYAIVTYGDSVMGTTRAIARDLDDELND